MVQSVAAKSTPPFVEHVDFAIEIDARPVPYMDEPRPRRGSTSSATSLTATFAFLEANDGKKTRAGSLNTRREMCGDRVG